MAYIMKEQSKAEKNTWVNRMRALLPDYIGFICCVAICLIVCGIALYAFHNTFQWKISYPADHSIWGLYGDFIGGVLGTLVAIFSVYYLIRTLREQQEANKKVSDNYKDVAEVYQVQQFDNNYQHLITLYQEAIAGYKHNNDETGRKALKIKICDLYNKEFDHTINYRMRVKAASSLFEKEFYIPNRVDAAVHFRVLYQIFNLIDSSELDERKYKAKYAKLVRSQIDEDELVLLRYNCWCKYGEKMRILINHYNLLKHLPPLSLLEFKYWHDNIVTDIASQNALDTELIAQRKWIIEKVSDSRPNGKQMFSTIISPRYELIISITADKKTFTYRLIRHEDTYASMSIDAAFDSLGDIHTINFIKDFMHEVFEFSNFEIFNKSADIKYTGRAISKDEDRMTTSFEVLLESKLPMCLRYSDYINGIQESSPERMS